MKHHTPRLHRAVHVVLLCVFALLAPQISAQNYVWQEDQATVLPHGDLQWAPKPFVYEAGSVVRYIDYESGSDANDGSSTSTAWKHHPWDPNATGNADAHSGITTYVFKGGVIYRGNIQIEEDGLPGDPMRLTRDPSWVATNPAMGTDLPILVGSDRLPDNWVKADTLDAATLNARIPEPDKVWALDINSLVTLNADGEGIEYDVPDTHFDKTMATGGSSTGNSFVGLFRVNNDSADTIFVAQTPDRQPGNDNFQLDYWHAWDGSKTYTDPVSGEEIGGIYDAWLQDPSNPDDWFVGGNIWPQYPWAMGTPISVSMPYENSRGGVTAPYYNPAEGTFRQGAQGGLKANVRYKIDNLPQFLDTAGEHYLDLDTGILYYRPEAGGDPNTMDLELITRWGSIGNGKSYGVGFANIVISGLRFSFTHGNVIGVGAGGDNWTCENITIKNCEFRDIANKGIAAILAEHKEFQYIDNLRITDNYFENIWTRAIDIEDGFGYNGDFGELGHVEILRNKIFNSGIQHSDNSQSAVEAINLRNPRTAVVAGNIVERTFGSGIMVFGGRAGTSARNDTIKDIPLTRILIFQNKTEDTATGNNDYGGMSLWQSGSTYAYNNIVGNSPGHMPGGWFGDDPINLSYPLYLDGAFKIYSFNNIIWGRTTDPADPYRNMNQAYFMVFGFLNDFANNTVYNFGEAMGGSSGARQNIQGNLMAEISTQFFRHAHGSLPSQIGGGDTNDTAGVASLAYENNLFHGEGIAGDVASIGQGADKDIDADDFPTMQDEMEAYPIRLYGLGAKEVELPIASGAQGPIDDLATSNVDFRPNGGSAAIDGGGTPFIPWGLYGVVGEWQFNKNLRDPQQVIDYHWYMSTAHVERGIYHLVPTFTLEVNSASAPDYVASESEDWTEGALLFGGTRHATVTDASIKSDIEVNIVDFTDNWSKGTKDIVKAARDNPEILWNVPEPSGGYDADGDPVFGSDQLMTFPGLERKTPHITTQNLLVEAIVRVDSGQIDEAIAGKHDGSNGYRLFVDSNGKAVLEISSGGTHNQVTSNTSVNTGDWVHILAEVDRDASGNTMTIYIDGAQDAQATGGSITDTDSLGNSADFIVGADNSLANNLHGAMDFLRVAHGTLAQAKTTIEELYTWQTDGPARYDLAGNAPVGQRDSGTLEATNPFSVSGLQGTVDVATGNIILSWQDNSTGEDGLLIQRSTSSDMSENLTEWNVSGSDLTTWSDTTAASGTIYYYRVFAKLGADISPASQILRIAPGTEMPDLPAKIGFEVDEANSQILVEWDILDQFNVEKLPASWTVRWTTTSGSGYSSATGLTESKHTITGIDPAQTYHITIEAINGTGSAETQEFSVREVEEDFSGLAVGEFPVGWSIEGAINASVTDSAPLASPSGTPIVGAGGKWDSGYIRFDDGHDMQYYRVDAVISAAQALQVYRADNAADQFDNFSVTEKKSQLVFTGSRTIDLIPDAGEVVGNDPAIDGGQEFWTMSLMTGPASNGDPAYMNIYMRVLDETGANRINTTDSLIDEVIGDWVVIYNDARPSSLRETFALYCKSAGNNGTYIDSLNILPFVYPGVTFNAPPPPPVVEDPLVYESFDYTSATLGNSNGGTGWTGDWSEKFGNPSPWSQNGSSLSYGSLQTEGDAYGDQSSTAEPRAEREWLDAVSTSFDENGGTIWYSFLLKVDNFSGGGWINFTGGNTFSPGFGMKIESDGDLLGHMSPGLPTRHFMTPYNLTSGTTYLVVGKVESSSTAGDDTYSLWVNPVSGLSEPVDGNDAAFYDSMTADWAPSGNTLAIEFGGNNAGQFIVDEIRIGETYGSVAPGL